MRKVWMAFLTLAVASLLLVPAQVCAVVQEMMPEDPRNVTRAAKLRTAADPADPDTVWIGHIFDPTFDAGGTMQAGGYGPYKVGRGDRLVKRAGFPATAGANGTWDWDRFQPGETDSLQGWWPIARPNQTSRATAEDWKRASFGFDYGNNVNYVINQGSPKRTFGVVGLWHRDRGNTVAYSLSDSIPNTNVQPVQWSPTDVGGAGSTASAWCGLRSHGDLSHSDAASNGGTGNPFNASLLDYQGNNGFFGSGSEHLGLSSFRPEGTDHNFPGYCGQLDQMLYRDVALSAGQNLNLSFNFSTNMSTAKQTSPRSEVGWFDKDPLSNAKVGLTASSDGNFISATVARGLGDKAPADSFMVYVGAPVDDGNVLRSNGTTAAVYDKKRRWFSEVLRLDAECLPGSPCTIKGKQIMSVTGVNAPQNVTLDFAQVYGQPLLDQIIADGGGKVRIVFRVKTNRGWDDENAGNPTVAFNSGTRGAAIIDNVVVNSWAASNGDFEAADAINNDENVLPVNTWKSTGKPPQQYWHVHDVSPTDPKPLAYNDPCGGLDNPNRICNLYGKIVTPGDHDHPGEKVGGLFGSNSQDRSNWLASPTINLSSTGNGPGFYNAMGIDDEIARTTFDYTSYFSLYNAGFFQATTQTGQFWQVGWQSYPSRQPNGNIKWGETRHVRGISFYGFRACLELNNFAPAKTNSLIATTNAQNRPDSLRAYIHRTGICFSFAAVTEATCAPDAGDNVGTYYDNFSVALIDGAPAPAISHEFWDMFNDAFPRNRETSLVGTSASFDTCAAEIRTGQNRATGSPKPNISGDSAVVAVPTPPGGARRVDLVFRILPGVGNYVTIGNKSSGVARRPDANPRVKATANDGSFFGRYMVNNGPYGSPGNHIGKGPGGTDWSQHIWNSARMDTVEYNLFPTSTNGGAVGLVDGRYRTTLHEDDPNFGPLGTTKPICVMPIPDGPANSNNMLCDGTGWGSYGAAAGWDGVTTTKEHTKIIPDGLLTPGSHVQYFFRVSDATDPATMISMFPDTHMVFHPGWVDGFRWMSFGVLPDRWKDGLWSVADRNASAPACMLFVDWQDRRGDERFYVGVFDTIGATEASRRGAHNGWTARGDQNITVAVSTDPSIAVYTHGGQPGTIWDMYGVKASESFTTSTGWAGGAPGTGLQIGKEDTRGPTGAMLRNYYRILLATTGDLLQGNIGPFADKTSDDTGLLNDFANNPEPLGSQPRMIWFQGRGFVQGQIAGGAAAHPDWIRNYFGADLLSGNYRGYAGNANDIVDLTPSAPIVTDGSIYGVLSNCVIENDVLSVSTTGATWIPPAAMVAKYPDTGIQPNPKIASIHAGSTLPSTAHPMITLADGFRISSLGSRFTLQQPGMMDYYFKVIVNMFGSLNCLLVGGAPVSVGENPNNALVNFLALRSENPMREGAARITFGITRTEKVELRVYDVTGRLVKTLANREFKAGNHELFWDGTNDDGQLVARGVYFYQLRTPTFVSQRKLAVLRK